MLLLSLVVVVGLCEVFGNSCLVVMRTERGLGRWVPSLPSPGNNDKKKEEKRTRSNCLSLLCFVLFFLFYS